MTNRKLDTKQRVQHRKTDANQKMTIVTKRMTVKVRVWIVLVIPKSKRVMNTTVNYPEFR
ncbi:MAG: hypothetical protein WAQ29_02745 [Nitrososphaeraceae archaeon]